MLALMLAVSGLALGGCDSTPAKDDPASTADSATPPADTATPPANDAAGQIDVKVVIDISKAVAEQNETALLLKEKDGELITYNVTVPEGSTVLEVLRASGAVVGTTAASFGEYVSSINSLAEGAVSAESGWTFFVNGEFATEGASTLKVNPGDEILWQYVTSWE